MKIKPAVLFYNPPGTNDAKDWKRPMPLNILSACSLIDTNKFEISIVQEMPDVALEELTAKLDNAICVCISCMTGVQITHGLKVSKKLREIKPSLTIIWGGYHPSAIPDQTLQNEYVDLVVRGYGEKALAEVVDRLNRNVSYQDVEGISFVKDGKVTNNPEGSVPKMDDLPMIPYHLFDMEKYFEETGERTLHYISSRGCPHKCGFCSDIVIYKSRWNSYSAERVLSDLEFLKKKYNFDSVRFYDSNLFVNQQRTKKICEGVIEKNLNFKWMRCNGDGLLLGYYSLETIKLMKKAGVSQVLIGAETGYEPAMKIIDKPATSDQIMKTIKLLHEGRISIVFSFMFGFPYDMPKEERRVEHQKENLATMKAIAKFSDDYLPGDEYLYFIFTAFPGVRLLERYKQLGYKTPLTFEEWGHVNLNESESSPWIDTDLFKQYEECREMLWFFQNRLQNFSVITNKNRMGTWSAKFWDSLVQNRIKKRINKGILTLPIDLQLLKSTYTRAFNFYSKITERKMERK